MNESVASDWDTYWRGSAEGATSGGNEVDHPRVRQFWTERFNDVGLEERPRLLDVASGAGAVVHIASGILEEDGMQATCVDTSAAAIETLKKSMPFVEGIVANAEKLPFPDNAFDIVTSQFGVEYAGLGAVEEMARVTVPGGLLVMLMHLEDGLIHEESRADVAAIEELQATGFIAAARRIFSEARRCLRGETEGSREDYDRAVQDMIPISQQVEALLRKYGSNAAGGTLATLHRETDRIYGRIMHHDLDEVLEWLDRMDEELSSFRGRMLSMCEAASPEADLQALAGRLEEDGFEIVTSEPLTEDAGRALAWQILARKKAAA